MTKGLFFFMYAKCFKKSLVPLDLTLLLLHAYSLRTVCRKGVTLFLAKYKVHIQYSGECSSN